MITAKSKVSGNADANLATASLSREYRIKTDSFAGVCMAPGIGGRILSATKCLGLTEAACRILALAAVLWLGPQAQVVAQSEAPPTSKGENFSAGKPPAQLFASDCTGAGCHKGPQGLTKRLLPGSLTGFLREHYTNSRESAAALANYLSKLPSAPEPKERE